MIVILALCLLIVIFGTVFLAVWNGFEAADSEKDSNTRKAAIALLVFLTANVFMHFYTIGENTDLSDRVNVYAAKEAQIEVDRINKEMKDHEAEVFKAAIKEAVQEALKEKENK